MRNVLVTGGTNFVSRYVAEYFVRLGDKVFVLNRGSKEQSQGVIHIKGDRSNLGDLLKGYSFDAVLDVTAYTEEDVCNLLDALGDFTDYILISSSAVYPDTLPMPFSELSPVGQNRVWGAYGTNKIKAEEVLLQRVPEAYILRPPYLYGPMQNLYRELFVFDCAEKDRPFVLPSKGKMNLQFFHVEDLCRFMNILLEKKPQNRIYNVGNSTPLSIKEWVKLCYEVTGKTPVFADADKKHSVRSYFCFYDYEYCLDVSRMSELMSDTKPLAEGLSEEYDYYKTHKDEMDRKPYIQYIDKEILK